MISRESPVNPRDDAWTPSASASCVSPHGDTECPSAWTRYAFARVTSPISARGRTPLVVRRGDAADLGEPAADVLTIRCFTANVTCVSEAFDGSGAGGRPERQ
jgi:hypothetical protein